jgi:hypothetical protein
MAGPIRQPIDIPALERYLEKNTNIKAPLDIKQVFSSPLIATFVQPLAVDSSLSLQIPLSSSDS